MTSSIDPTLVAATRQRFLDRFGRLPQWIAAAPGRVNLIGDHVDYNDGFVLPFAIERWTLAAGGLASNSKSTSTIVSVQCEQEIQLDLNGDQQPKPRGWATYTRGVAHGFRQTGVCIPTMHVLIHSDLPVGSGLSSSAALEVALVTLFEAISNHKLDPLAKAVLCQQAEHDFAGVPCGLMDPFVSIHGQRDHLLLIDCREQTWQAIPFDRSELALLVIDSQVQHALGSSEYSNRRRCCESAAKALGVHRLRDVDLEFLNRSPERLSPVQTMRARHVVTEIARTLRFVECLSQRNWVEAGRLMYESHASLRDDFQTSCRETDRIVEIAGSIGTRAGIYGARMTGGGFGGSVVALVRSDAVESIVARIEAELDPPSPETSVSPQPSRPRLFQTHPAEGARLL